MCSHSIFVNVRLSIWFIFGFWFMDVYLFTGITQKYAEKVIFDLCCQHNITDVVLHTDKHGYRFADHKCTSSTKF